MDTIRTQLAKKQHASYIAELIYNSEDEPNLIWGAGSKEEVLKRLENLIRRTDTRYSYKYAKVAICNDNDEVCGVVIALPHSLIDSLEKNTSKALLKTFTFKDRIKYIIKTLKYYNLEESQKGEFYIANLATSEKYRNKGIATKLMKEAEQVAKNYKLQKCSLLVNKEKQGAFNLYSKLNYMINGEISYGQNNYFRMIKAL